MPQLDSASHFRHMEELKLSVGIIGCDLVLSQYFLNVEDEDKLYYRVWRLVPLSNHVDIFFKT